MNDCTCHHFCRARNLGRLPHVCAYCQRTYLTYRTYRTYRTALAYGYSGCWHFLPFSACVANWITKSADHNRLVPHGRQYAIGTQYQLRSKNSLTCLFQIPSGPPLKFTVSYHLIFNNKPPETVIAKSLSTEIKFHGGLDEHIAGGSGA